MTSKREQFYKQQIAYLQVENAALKEQVAELLKVNEVLVRENAELAEQIAKLSRDSSNSSKPPSSDIVKSPRPKQSDEPRRHGGGPGHKGVNRRPFGPERIDKTVEFHAGCCDCGYKGPGKPIDKPKIQQTVEFRPDPAIVTEYRLYGYICPECGRIVWAKLPAGVIEGQRHNSQRFLQCLCQICQ